MVVLTWLLLINPFLQTESILDVFLRAFLPQGRSNIEQLSDYFYNKIKPRLEENQYTITVWDQDNLVAFAIFEKWKSSKVTTSLKWLFYQNINGKASGNNLCFPFLIKIKGSKILLVTEKTTNGLRLSMKRLDLSVLLFNTLAILKIS